MKTIVLIFGLIAACRPDPDPASTARTAPRYEGDRITASFPARLGLTPKQMFDQVVAPMLRQKGLGAVVGSIAVPPRGYVYQQRLSGVPVEHAVLIATPTSVQGTILSRYRIMNRATLSSAKATPRDRIALRSELVLLPAGNTSDGRVELRYAHRMLLADRNDRRRTWMAWIDAQSGKTLNLAPQFIDE